MFGKLEGRVEALEIDKDFSSLKTIISLEINELKDIRNKSIADINMTISESTKKIVSLNDRVSSLENLKKNKNIPIKEITSYDGRWGDWHKDAMCPDGQYVCGMRVRFEKHEGGDFDDTALNAVRLKCCAFLN